MEQPRNRAEFTGADARTASEYAGFSGPRCGRGSRSRRRHLQAAVAATAPNEKPLAALYDSVLLPALSLAEQDRHKGIPAHDGADEVMTAMLAQLLEQKGFTTLSFPIAGPSPNEVLAAIEPGRDDAVCISALPP